MSPIIIGAICMVLIIVVSTLILCVVEGWKACEAIKDIMKGDFK